MKGACSGGKKKRGKFGAGKTILLILETGTFGKRRTTDQEREGVGSAAAIKWVAETGKKQEGAGSQLRQKGGRP